MTFLPCTEGLSLGTWKTIKCSNFVILAKAGIHAGSGKMPLEEMDSRMRGKDNDIFVMYRGTFPKYVTIAQLLFYDAIIYLD